MSLTSLIVQQSVIMLLLIMVGAVCFKTKIISKDGSKELSKLVLTIVNPAIIISSFQKDFDKTLIRNLVIATILSILSYAITIFLAYVLVRNKKNKSIADIDIERFSCIYSNCGFMGIPLVNALFGSEGVFYLTAFLAAFNLIVWTHGSIQISGVKSFDSIKKAIFSPALISIFAGLIIFIAQIKLPETLSMTIKYIGDMNTPLAMTAAGVTIAQTNIFKAFQKPRIYFLSLVRLVIIPIILILIMKPLHIDETVVMTVIIASSAPSAAMCTLFSIQYGKNSLYASEIFTVTTILSIVTLPLMVMIFQSVPF